MKSPSEVAFSVLQRGLLSGAALLVPACDRDEWRREWLAELWHVRRSLISIDETFSLDSQREITGFCLGAFADAICVRNLSDRTSAPSAHMHCSAAQTLLWLFVILLLCLLITSLLPGVQAENEAARFQIDRNVLLISEAAASRTKPSIPADLYRGWKKTPQRFFDNLAFYRVTRETADSGSARISWNVARATANLFPTLGLPLTHTAETGSDLSSIVLSHEAWMRSFGGDPRIAGRILRIGNASVRIAGVAPAGAWQLPGSPDVWLLEPDAQIASEVSAKTPGYFFAQLSARGQAARTGPGITISARDPENIDIDLSGTPLTAPVEGPWNLYEFALFLALIALPAVSSVSLGETHLTSHRPSFKQSLRRFLFLGAKFALIAGIALFASFDLAYWYTPNYSPVAECVQLISCFLVCLSGFRWALADQRHRCPVCLRRVTNPATVGLASRTFLGWNGTEMICMGGHTLLHVPALPTSWFSDQRWLYLDSSWQFLFADTGVY
jgi:hypothetical protein